MQDQNAAKLSSINTYMLVALVFNIFVLLSWLILTVLLLIVIIGVIFIVPLIFSILTLRRILKMRRAAGTGDVATLKSMNSVLWGIIALIFSGVIPGILLLVANGTINELNSSASAMPSSIPVSRASEPTESKFCVSCGAKIAKSATFCPNCGAAQPA